MPLSPADMELAMIRNLKEKTGKNLEEWIALVMDYADLSDKELLPILKDTHDLGHFQAKMIIKYRKGYTA